MIPMFQLNIKYFYPLIKVKSFENGLKRKCTTSLAEKLNRYEALINKISLKTDPTYHH